MPAISTLHRLVQSAETDAVALAAAKDILDRCGFKPTDKLEQAQDVHITVSYADIDGTLPVQHVNGTHALNGSLDRPHG